MSLFDRFKKKEQAKPTPNINEIVGTTEGEMFKTANQYANKDADKIYIICGGQNEIDWFYLIRGRILAKNELNAVGDGEYDVSDAAVQQCGNKLAAGWQKICKTYADFQKPVPKGFCMTYDNRSKKFAETVITDNDIDVPATMESWKNTETKKFEKAGGTPAYDWKNAYRANVRYYGNDVGDIIGNYAIGEGVDTILPVYPRAAYEGKEIKNWQLSLVSMTEDKVIARVNYRTAIKVLPEITGTQIVDDVMFVQGPSLEQLRQLVDKCGSLS
jgi:hypothetical protein